MATDALIEMEAAMARYFICVLHIYPVFVEAFTVEII